MYFQQSLTYVVDIPTAVSPPSRTKLTQSPESFSFKDVMLCKKTHEHKCQSGIPPVLQNCLVSYTCTSFHHDFAAQCHRFLRRRLICRVECRKSVRELSLDRTQCRAQWKEGKTGKKEHMLLVRCAGSVCFGSWPSVPVLAKCSLGEGCPGKRAWPWMRWPFHPSYHRDTSACI